MNFEPRFVDAVTPQLYIGLGGMGGRIVERIEKHLQRDKEWLRYRDDSTSFLVIDTNSRDLDGFGAVGRVRCVHTARMGRKAALQRMLESGDPWLPTWLPKDYVPRETGDGAGQIRIESRVGAYVYSPDIATLVRQEVDRIIAPTNRYLRRSSKAFEVFVFGSLAGGTCSGSAHVVPYLVRQQIEDRGWGCRIYGHLLLATAVEDFVDPLLLPYVHGNSYAALKEIEHLTRATYDGQAPVELAYRQPRTRREPVPMIGAPPPGAPAEHYRVAPPYDWIVLIDEPSRLSLGDRAADAVADTAYLNLMSPAQAAEAGARDNYTRFMRRVGSVKGGGLGAHGYTKHYGTFGAAALVCPEETLIRYGVERFVAHIVESQLGGIEPDDDFDPLDARWSTLPSDTRLRVLNSRWRNAVTRLAQREQDLADDNAAMLQKVAPDVTVGATDVGYWSMLHIRVDGRVEGVGAPAAADELAAHDPFAAQKHDGSASGPKSLRASVRERLEVGVKQLPQVRQVNRNFDDVRSGFTSDFNQLKQEFERVAGEAEPIIRRCVDEIEDGGLFDQVRKGSGQVDALTERFLVMRLLFEDVGNWLADARKKEEATRRGSLAADDDAPLREPWSALQEQAVAHASRGPLRRLLSLDRGVEEEIGRQGSQLREELVDRSNAYLKAHALRRQLESLRTFVEGRARVYAELTLVAANTAREARNIAERIRLGDSLDKDDFLLRVEALDPLDELAPRQWHLVWEDVLLPALASDLRDSTWMASEIADAMAAEQRKAKKDADEGGAPTIQVGRLVADIEQRFRLHAQRRVSALISGDPTSTEVRRRVGFDLFRALELEALYESLPAGTTPSDRRKLVAQAADARDADLAASMATYVHRKLAALKNKAVLLATVDPEVFAAQSSGPDRAFRSAILVADQATQDELSAHYPEALETLMREEGDGADGAFRHEPGRGLQTWDDPRMMMLFRAVGVLTAQAFVNVEEAHDYYETIQSFGARKPHDLHTDRNWEYTLTDIVPDAVRERQRKAQERLVRLVRAGLVRASDAGFVLELDTVHEDLGRDALALSTQLDSVVYRRPDLDTRLDDALRDATGLRQSRFEVATAIEQAVEVGKRQSIVADVLDACLSTAEAIRAK